MEFHVVEDAAIESARNRMPKESRTGNRAAPSNELSRLSLHDRDDDDNQSPNNNMEVG